MISCLHNPLTSTTYNKFHNKKTRTRCNVNVKFLYIAKDTKNTILKRKLGENSYSIFNKDLKINSIQRAPIKQ